MSDFLEVLDDVQRKNGSLAQPRGSSFMQVLDDIQDNREGNYQASAQEVQPQSEEGETELHRALQKTGVPDWIIDDGLEAFLRFEANLGMGFNDTFLRKWMNVPALAMRGLGMASENLLGGESMFTQGANWLNDIDARYAANSEAARRSVTGNNPTYWDNMVHGAGTSLGHAAEGLILGPLAKLHGASNFIANLVRFGTQAFSESMTEAGNTTSELYAQDKNRGNDAFWAGMQSLAANAPLDALTGLMSAGIATGLDALIYPEIATGVDNVFLTDADKPIKYIAKNFFNGLVREELEELTQEPRQQAVEAAVKNTFNSKDMSWSNYGSNLWQEVKHILPYTDKNGIEQPGYFMQVAPETAGSTLLTSLLLAPFGVPSSIRINETQESKAKDNYAKDLLKEREELQKEVNDAYIRNNDGSLDDSIAEMESGIKTITNELASLYNDDYNLGIHDSSDSVQDDAGYDLFKDIHESNQIKQTPAQDINMDNTQEAPITANPDTVQPAEISEPLVNIVGADINTINNRIDTNGNNAENIQNNEPDLLENVKQDDDPNPMDMLFGNNNNQGNTQQNNIPEDFDDVDDEPDADLEDDYSEQYNQLITSDYNQSNNYADDGSFNVGTFIFGTQSRDYSFNVVLTQHNGSRGFSEALNNRLRRWSGRYLEIRNNRGKVIAIYYPAFGTLSFAPDIEARHSLRWKQKFEYDFRAKLQAYLNGGGLLDESGNLKPDGNEAFRRRWAAKIGDDENSFDSNELQPEDIDAPEIGKFTVSYQNGDGIETTKDLSVVLGQFGDNMPEHKQYFGSYFDIMDGGRVIARYAPRTNSIRFTSHKDAGFMKHAIMQQLKRKAKSFMRNAGFLDADGKLIPDGYEEYRAKRKAANSIPNAFPASAASRTNSYGKIARVRTIKGTEANVRYKVVDVNDLIVSTNETGTPNPKITA